jgi:Rieske Fe-S protein
VNCEDCPQPDHASVPAGCGTRRAVLLGTGAVAAAAVLAACATSPGSQTSVPAGAGTASRDLGPTSAIPVGGGRVFAEQDVVVTQPTKGNFKAFTATCTHQGCIVGRVKDGLIICPCHGSRYSITDGSVVQGPAPSPLAELAINVTAGQITLD